jgi:uncharacterized protein YbjT (DUF2867 family)
MEHNVFAVTGITGKVGGETARRLLAAKQPVRAVLRDVHKRTPWEQRGCDVAIADINDAAALAAAFDGALGVFILLPPNLDPAPGFPEARAAVAAVSSALEAARPAKVVCISTIGAQATRSNLLTQLTILELVMSELPMPVTFLRPAWFMENYSWDVVPARDNGVIQSFLQPLDKCYPMVATADVGRTAADLLRQTSTGPRIVELEGPRRITPREVAATFAEVLGRPVRAAAIPLEKWEGLFQSQGMRYPAPRIQMLDGFNQGWIEFESGEEGSQKGTTSLKAVVRALVEQQRSAVSADLR